MRRFLGAVGALFGLAGVGLLARAAHGAAALEMEGAAALMQTAGLFALGHAAPLLWLSSRLPPPPRRLWAAAAALLLVGPVLFCVAIVALTHGIRLAGMAPIGGSATLLGWLVLALAAAVTPTAVQSPRATELLGTGAPSSSA